MKNYTTTAAIRLILCLLALSPLQLLSQTNSNPRVIRSYHLGPWAPETTNKNNDNNNNNNNNSSSSRIQGRCTDKSCANPDMSRDTLVVNEDGSKFYNPPPCQYCIQCQYQHWCPYCGYCPIYDESDIVDEYDRHATWPSKRSDSWMRELDF